jgi:hypothetical protein
MKILIVDDDAMNRKYLTIHRVTFTYKLKS